MKRIFTIIMISISVCTLTACDKEVKEAKPEDLGIDIILDLLWEQYLIDAYNKRVLDIDGVDEIIILGTVKEHEYTGEHYSTRYYMNDSSVKFTLEVIFKFDNESTNHIHHYTFEYTEYIQFNVTYQPSYSGTLQIIDEETDFDSYYETLIQTNEERQLKYYEYMEDVIEDIDEVSESDLIYNFTLLEENYTYDELDPYFTNVLEFVELDSILYMVLEEEVYVIYGKSPDSHPVYMIHSHILEKPVTTIYAGAFAFQSILHLSIPDTVLEIQRDSFSNAIVLETTFEGDSSLKVIRKNAFDNFACHSFFIPSSVEIIEQDAFPWVSGICTIYTDIDEAANGWSDGWIRDHEVVWGTAQDELN